jgi:centriolar protein POC1
VLASTNNKTISMFDLRTEEIVQHYEAHHASVNSFSVHPEGTHMISVSTNSEIKVRVFILRCGI